MPNVKRSRRPRRAGTSSFNAAPVPSLLSVTINHSFSAAGDSTYAPTDVVKDTGVLCVKPTSLRITIAAEKPCIAIFRAYLIDEKSDRTCVFTSNSVVLGASVQVVSLKMPRRCDHASGAQWVVSANGACTFAGVARFSMMDPMASG